MTACSLSMRSAASAIQASNQPTDVSAACLLYIACSFAYLVHTLLNRIQDRFYFDCTMQLCLSMHSAASAAQASNQPTYICKSRMPRTNPFVNMHWSTLVTGAGLLFLLVASRRDHTLS